MELIIFTIREPAITERSATKRSYGGQLAWQPVRTGSTLRKYEGNPILTWFPNQNGEEGAVSSGVTLGEQGATILFYAANTQESPITVNADVRVASSLDGFIFTDLGIVLNRRDPSVWGNGDELFAVDTIYDSGQWIVYYIPNGTAERGLLGVAYGNEYNALNQSSAVTSGGKPISVWGTARHVELDQDTYALILNNVREKRTEVRQVSWQTPNLVSEPVVVYQFDEVQQAVLLLDEENEIWFMYYRTFENSYGVKLAPAGDKPLPAPSTPQDFISFLAQYVTKQPHFRFSRDLSHKTRRQIPRSVVWLLAGWI